LRYGSKYGRLDVGVQYLDASHSRWFIKARDEAHADLDHVWWKALHPRPFRQRYGAGFEPKFVPQQSQHHTGWVAREFEQCTGEVLQSERSCAPDVHLGAPPDGLAPFLGLVAMALVGHVSPG
jgi:hypothetical protein